MRQNYFRERIIKIKKKYAIICMHFAYTVVDKVLFESDDIKEILNKLIEYTFDGCKACQLRVIKILSVTISGKIQIDNLGGDHSASSEIRKNYSWR